MVQKLGYLLLVGGLGALVYGATKSNWIVAGMAVVAISIPMLRSRPTSGIDDPGFMTASQSRGRSRLWLLRLTAIVLIGGVAAGTYYWFRSVRPVHSPRAQAQPPVPAEDPELPPAELSKLTGEASHNSFRLECSIYNGTMYSISSILIQVNIYRGRIFTNTELDAMTHSPATLPPPPQGYSRVDPIPETPSKEERIPLQVRRFVARPRYGSAEPTVATEFTTSGFTLQNGETWTWTILSARGQRVSDPVWPSAQAPNARLAELVAEAERQIAEKAASQPTTTSTISHEELYGLTSRPHAGEKK